MPELDQDSQQEKLGARGGTETETITQNQMPSHTHFAVNNLSAAARLKVTTEDGTSNSPDGKYLAASTVSGGETARMYASDPEDGEHLANGTLTVSGNITAFNTGATQFHNNMQPYLVINWIICLQGVFPSRN